jgi:hypothetical protein
MSWKELEVGEPELGAFGLERLNDRVAYLATVRKDGSPRLHPFTPIIGEGHLFVFMEPTSPKGHDLMRDARCAIHCSVNDTSGVSGEFFLTGRGRLVEEADLRATAVRLASYSPADRYVLFEFEIDSATATTYPDSEPVRRAWRRSG